MPLLPRWPALTLTFDLQNLISNQVISKGLVNIICKFRQYCWSHLWDIVVTRSIQTNEQTNRWMQSMDRQKTYPFTNTVGWWKHNKQKIHTHTHTHTHTHWTQVLLITFTCTTSMYVHYLKFTVFINGNVTRLQVLHKCHQIHQLHCFKDKCV